MGLISSGIILGTPSTSVLMGWLVDTVGARRVLIATPPCVAVMVLAFSQTQNLFQAILLGFLMSAAAGGMDPASIRAIMQWVRPRSRALATGIQSTAVPICGIVAALLLPFLAVTFSWRISAMVLAGMILAAGMVLLLFYRDNPESVYARLRRGSPLKDISLVAGNRDIWLVCTFTMTLMTMQYVMVGYLILFLKDELGISAVLGGVFLAVFQASGAVWRIAWGLVSDVLLRGRRVPALALMGMITVMSMALMTWLPSDAPLLLVGMVIAVVGAGFMGWATLHPILLAELAGPGLTGTVVGFGRAIMRIGGFGIPPLFGLVVDRTGSYDMGWWMMAGMVSVGTLALAFLRRETRGS